MCYYVIHGVFSLIHLYLTVKFEVSTILTIYDHYEIFSEWRNDIHIIFFVKL